MTIFSDATAFVTEAEICEATEPRAADERWAAELAEKARLRSMVDTHFDNVCVALRRLGVPPADIEDGAQQVFVVAARKVSAIEKGRERAFLMGTAVHVASRLKRTKRRRPEVAECEGAAIDGASTAMAPDDMVEQKERRALLDEVLAAMPEDLRVPLVLFELEELTMQEIGVALELPMGTVASRLRRAREVFSKLSARAVANRGRRA
jgi:RNA polymerase sigma-70 factor (ECF subfamily)